MICVLAFRCNKVIEAVPVGRLWPAVGTWATSLLII